MVEFPRLTPLTTGEIIRALKILARTARGATAATARLKLAAWTHRHSPPVRGRLLAASKTRRRPSRRRH